MYLVRCTMYLCYIPVLVHTWHSTMYLYASTQVQCSTTTCMYRYVRHQGAPCLYTVQGSLVVRLLYKSTQVDIIIQSVVLQCTMYKVHTGTSLCTFCTSASPTGWRTNNARAQVWSTTYDPRKPGKWSLGHEETFAWSDYRRISRKKVRASQGPDESRW